MDNLTHSLVGVLLSRAGLNRFVPHAAPLLFLAANAPDADVVTLLFPSPFEAYLDYHRGITHAIIATPLVAILPLLVIRLLFRKNPVPWGRGLLVSSVGVASHWVLDFTNAYGIRLFLPFNGELPALDICHVVDVWIWAVLLFAVLWPMLSRLVGSEIGASKGTVGRGWATAALVFVLCWDAARFVLHQRAVAVQEAHVYQGATPRRVLAIPTAFNPLEWRGIVETDSFWVLQPVSLRSEFDPLRGQVLYKPEVSPAIQAARTTRSFRSLEQFSRTLHWRVSPAADGEGAMLVEATDLRLRFTASALVDARGNVTESRLSPGR